MGTPRRCTQHLCPARVGRGSVWEPSEVLPRCQGWRERYSLSIRVPWAQQCGDRCVSPPPPTRRVELGLGVRPGWTN